MKPFLSSRIVLQTIAISLILFPSLNSFAQEDLFDPALLPEQSSESKVEGLKYPVSNRWRLSLHAFTLSGNRFVDSFGPQLAIRYFLSETFSATAAYAKVLNSVRSEVQDLQAIGATPSLANPASFFSGRISWHPYYGKLFGLSGLHHFRINLGIGAQMLSLEDVALAEAGQESDLDSGQILAPAISAGITAYLSSVYSLDLEAEYSTYSISNGISEIARSQWLYSLGLGVNL